MGLSRREFVGAAAGTAALASAGTTTGAAQSGPDYGGWFDDVDNFDGTTVDSTGEDTVEIAVGAEGNGGAFAFDPPAVRVSLGTEVVWKWTGNGGAHNVVSDGDGPLDSGETASEASTTYSHTFESEGTFKYACTPHGQLGMKGAVVIEASSDSGGDGETGDRGSTPDLSGPQWLLSGSVVLAFISPLLFAAVVRYRDKKNR